MLSDSVLSDSCKPRDYSPPGSPVHGISQARTLEWVAISFSRQSSWPRNQTHVSCLSCIAGGFFTLWQVMIPKDILPSDLEHLGWGGIEDDRRVKTKRRKEWRKHEGGSPKSNLVSHLLCWKPALPNKCKFDLLGLESHKFDLLGLLISEIFSLVNTAWSTDGWNHRCGISDTEEPQLEKTMYSKGQLSVIQRFLTVWNVSPLNPLCCSRVSCILVKNFKAFSVGSLRQNHLRSLLTNKFPGILDLNHQPRTGSWGRGPGVQESAWLTNSPGTFYTHQFLELT